MIDREKVIKGFECCHVMVHNLGPDKASCEICPYKDVQTEEQIDLGGIECIAVLHDDALALLKEQEQQRWILCSDRLPKSEPDDLEYPIVIIALKDGTVELGCYFESTKEWGAGENFDRPRKPVAWMPLPMFHKERQ